VDEFIEGEADTIEYDGKADRVKFIKPRRDARYAAPRWPTRPRRLITYDNTTDVFTVDGSAAAGGSPANPGRRAVRATMAPRPPASAPAAPGPGRACAPAPPPGRSPVMMGDAALHARPATPHEQPAGGAPPAEVLRRRKVVKDVSLAVDKGEVVGLLGPNGAGKTTSFYMIVGLVRADGGEISIDGQPVEHMPIHRRSRLGLSYLPQEASIFRKLNVADNVRAVLELQHGAGRQAAARAEIEERLTALLQDLRVEHLRDSPALALSGGERRRVEIARALATQPRFILLDEPFAGIDPIAVIEIQRIIGFLKSRGIGVLITDHNVRETLGICDHAYIISDGRCWHRARRPTSSTTPTCAGSTSASTSECRRRPPAYEAGPFPPRLAAPGADAPAAAVDPAAAAVHAGAGQEVEQMLDDNPFLEVNRTTRRARSSAGRSRRAGAPTTANPKPPASTASERPPPRPPASAEGADPGPLTMPSPARLGRRRQHRDRPDDGEWGGDAPARRNNLGEDDESTPPTWRAATSRCRPPAPAGAVAAPGERTARRCAS
jgi:lipopolysaccharide export system ATP-binding protein